MKLDLGQGLRAEAIWPNPSMTRAQLIILQTIFQMYT